MMQSQQYAPIAVPSQPRPMMQPTPGMPQPGMSTYYPMQSSQAPMPLPFVSHAISPLANGPIVFAPPELNLAKGSTALPQRSTIGRSSGIDKDMRVESAPAFKSMRDVRDVQSTGPASQTTQNGRDPRDWVTVPLQDGNRNVEFRPRGFSFSESSCGTGISTDWDVKSKFIMAMRTGPTEAPDHLLARSKLFPQNNFTSPYVLYYFDETAPNDILLKNDVLDPSRRAKQGHGGTAAVKAIDDDLSSTTKSSTTSSMTSSSSEVQPVTMRGIQNSAAPSQSRRTSQITSSSYYPSKSATAKYDQKKSRGIGCCGGSATTRGNSFSTVTNSTSGFKTGSVSKIKAGNTYSYDMVGYNDYVAAGRTHGSNRNPSAAESYSEGSSSVTSSYTSEAQMRSSNKKESYIKVCAAERCCGNNRYHSVGSNGHCESCSSATSTSSSSVTSTSRSTHQVAVVSSRSAREIEEASRSASARDTRGVRKSRVCCGTRNSSQPSKAREYSGSGTISSSASSTTGFEQAQVTSKAGGTEEGSYSETTSDTSSSYNNPYMGSAKQGSATSSSVAEPDYPIVNPSDGKGKHGDKTYSVRKMFFDVDEMRVPPNGTGLKMLPTYSTSYRNYPAICYDVVAPNSYVDYFKVRKCPGLFA